ncbi:hypothetical protein AAG906_001136 [Vitis piasezkii]
MAWRCQLNAGKCRWPHFGAAAARAGVGVGYAHNLLAWDMTDQRVWDSAHHNRHTAGGWSLWRNENHDDVDLQEEKERCPGIIKQKLPEEETSSKHISGATVLSLNYKNRRCHAASSSSYSLSKITHTF